MSWRDASTASVLDVYEFTWETEEAKAWEREPDPAGWQKSGVKKTETDLRDRRERGRQQVISYMENTVKERLRPWTLPDTGLPATEVPFEEDLGGVVVKGFIDLVLEDTTTNTLLVRDIKTGTKQPKGWFQLATYRFALKRKYGVDPQWGDYWMCKDGGPSSPIYLGGIPEQLITSQYQIVDAMINEEMYGANIGEHCNRCDVARHCPFVGGTPPEGVYMLGT